MKAALFALPFLVAALPASADGPSQPFQSLDLAGVTALRVIGEASAIEVTTNAGAPHVASLGAHRSGWFATWFSSWFDNDCRRSGRMWIENATLTVDAHSSGWLEPSDCEVRLEANGGPGLSVAIEQAASQVDLAGDFSAVSLANTAADFVLRGHAASVRLEAEALRSRLDFDRTDETETIAIVARALDTSLGFAPGTKISYDTRAKAALVNSALPNTPDAKPAITIRGDYVRATIR